MKFFTLDNGRYCYISVLHNIAFPDPESSLNSPSLKLHKRILNKSISPNFCQELALFIKSKVSEYFFVDFLGIDIGKERRVLLPFYEHSASIIFINCEQVQLEFSRELCCLCSPYKYEDYENAAIFARPNSYSTLCAALSNHNTTIKNYVASIPQLILGDFIIQKCFVEDIVLLPSSNVYANAYINIKAFFASPKYYTYIICLLHLRILRFVNKLTDAEQVGLICSSNNGAIIMDSIAETFKHEETDLCNYRHCNFDTVSFISIGPALALHNPESFELIKSDHVYIFIYDFMCLGTEMKLTRLLCSLKKTKIIGNFGVAEYADPDNRTGIANYNGALVHIAQLTDKKYIVAAAQYDIEKLLKN